MVVLYGIGCAPRRRSNYVSVAARLTSHCQGAWGLHNHQHFNVQGQVIYIYWLSALSQLSVAACSPRLICINTSMWMLRIQYPLICIYAHTHTHSIVVRPDRAAGSFAEQYLLPPARGALWIMAGISSLYLKHLRCTCQQQHNDGMHFMTHCVFIHSFTC